MQNRIILEDSEDRWFLNPQYKLELRLGTKIIVSLMQHDNLLTEQEYSKCNFIVMLSGSAFGRVWDIDEDNVIKTCLEQENPDKNADGDDESENSRNSNKIPREITMYLDTNEILKKVSEKKRKKLIGKEKIHLNIIPYLCYRDKFEIEKGANNQRIFSFQLIRIESREKYILVAHICQRRDHKSVRSASTLRNYPCRQLDSRQQRRCPSERRRFGDRPQSLQAG